jgi:hypothetical protein
MHTTRHNYWGRRAATALALAVTLAGALAGPASATWSAPGSGSAAGAAATMPTGATPSAHASGTSVTVTWSAAKFASGTAVAGYTIARYNATTGATATVGSACSGTISATTCTELDVAAGSWVYTDTPVDQNWRGVASAESASVTVT